MKGGAYENPVVVEGILFVPQEFPIEAIPKTIISSVLAVPSKRDAPSVFLFPCEKSLKQVD